MLGGYKQALHSSEAPFHAKFQLIHLQMYTQEHGSQGDQSFTFEQLGLISGHPFSDTREGPHSNTNTVPMIIFLALCIDELQASTHSQMPTSLAEQELHLSIDQRVQVVLSSLLARLLPPSRSPWTQTYVETFKLAPHHIE